MANGAEKDVEALLLKERVFRRRPGDVPYPVKYTNNIRTFDNWDHIFLKQCFRGLTLSQMDIPPEMVLDLGCGSGLWAIEAAEQWPNSIIIGMDVNNQQPQLDKLEPYKHLALRIKWVCGNFLDGLHFPANHFDFVRMARIGLGVPEDEWQFVLEEVSRVMKPGAVLEILEEDLLFPYCHAARRRPQPAPLDVDILPSESLPSTRSSITAYSSSPWGRSQEDLMDGSLQKKSSLSTLQESPTSTLPIHLSHFSPKSTFSHRSNSSNFVPRVSQIPSFLPPPQSSSFETHPQDHSRLKAAWDAMLSHRFLAPQLITVLPFYLSSFFVDIKTHPTLMIPLPPNSSSDSRIFCSTSASSSNTFDPEEQFELKRSAGRPSDSDENSSRRDSSNETTKMSSWAPMHLARTVQTVSACKEAIWDEYAKLHSPDLPPTTTQARLKEGQRAVISSRSAARESFDRAWGNWESDMTDRIGMRDNIMFEFLWTEPPGERPDWRVWRNSLDSKPFEGSPGSDHCRALRGFVAYKPKAR
ncbi:hypothetical protein GYMLUDRAFT_242078 [Collybiopsis luxurians FD-317 M1]|uniref:Methyltransferase domain-containing protein n=1 Tax=Collybiopsis luxurians FD-317 M1 TaxID=944289 RepID=A0A0D0BGL2_9AGAR|nr:hypothetical protein GYMLUDRAFT_242078 [Collybiopsis luxurians FD-317 M1]